ncbi:hypothetical protein ABZ897_45895 [Nonomuraea sp. NPDC046802]|uniref:hypothetical protein n=1 Tax=Nonomuraea sp. NPDC046802 TaxID=3154919 RepID=UPI0033D1EDB8
MVGTAQRLLNFEREGMASIGLWIRRRRHEVPPGATVGTYAKEQAFTMGLFMFAMAVEAIVVDLLLISAGVTPWLRYSVLAIDLYGLLTGLSMAASCVTRPHVVTDDELRVRYGVYFDLRVPRDQIAAVRTSRSLNESGMITVKDGRVSVAVASQTNVTVELTEPITVVRPLGARAEVTSIRFFAEDPNRIVTALRTDLPLPS